MNSKTLPNKSIATEVEEELAPGTEEPKFEVFRWSDGKDLAESMTLEAMTPEMQKNFNVIMEAGAVFGSESRVLFSAPGVSLTHVWFKSGFPVFLHSHSAGCLYYITAGSLRLGKQELRVGDGFYVPSDVRYSYSAGPSGVELLEFRNADNFDLKLPASANSFSEKVAEIIAGRVNIWRTEEPPAAEPIERSDA